MRSVSKVDEYLTSATIFLTTTTDKITPNTILFVTMVNGFALGYLTTGFLGESSMDVSSLEGGFFIWQFVLTCILTSKYVNMTTEYLGKFFLAGVIGYYVQWQVFGTYAEKYDVEMLKLIEPVIPGGSGNFIFILFFIMGIKHCFSGNELKQETKINVNVND